MRFGVLGPVEVIRDGEPLSLGGAKPRALLAVLLLNAGRVVPVERIIDDLWGEDVPDTAAKMVQIHVSQLRKQLGGTLIVTRKPGYVLELSGNSLDLDDVGRLIARGREELAAGDPIRAAATFRDAVALWRGTALVEFEEPFAAVEAARLEEVRVTCLEDRIEADLACGDHRDLVGELETLARRYPLRPRLHGQLMLALYRSGRHAEALDAYRQHRRDLDELGIEPGHELRELERRILQQDAILDLDSVLARRDAPAADALWVSHGDLLERDDALGQLVQAFDAAARGSGRVVLVTGEPGIGKTALVTTFLDSIRPRARILFGTCDDLSIPRPLGPFQDLAAGVSPAFAETVAAGADPHEFHSLLLAELGSSSRPTVIVLEDIHWADDATIDAITVLGRRIGSLPVLLAVTFRTGEAPPTHRLHSAVGALPTETLVRVDLEPLSAIAVESLAGDGADAVYAATAGNPFYVRELLASRSGTELPPSVSNAVRGRASRLEDDARHLVELVSVVPHRVATGLLDEVVPNWPAAAVEPERRQLIEVTASHVGFRHELARHAIRSSLPIAARRHLHAVILTALLASQSDPADIVHHAEAAGAEDVLSEYARVAARRAAALGSNREAFSHYRRASDFADRLPPAEQAVLFEELATSAHLVNRLDEAFPAIERAIAIHRELDDAAGMGRCLRVRSRFHWFAGEGEPARNSAREAVAILEPLGPSVELARAYSGLSALSVVAQDVEGTVVWGERALALATQLGDERTRAHTLVNLGTARVHVDPDAIDELLEAHAVADAAGDHFEAARALSNIAGTLTYWIRPQQAMQYAEQAIAYALDHEVHAIVSYAGMMAAWLRLRAGEWDDAERAARREIASGIPVSRLIAETSLTELAIRRGRSDAERLLTELTTQVDRAGELQRMTPVLELATEWALTTGAPMPTERFAAVVAKAEAQGGLTGWDTFRVPAWAAVAGIEMTCAPGAPEPFSAMSNRDWRRAADVFGVIGWPYDRALMLSLLEDEGALRESGEIAGRLGAEPLARHVTGRLAAIGAHAGDPVP